MRAECAYTFDCSRLIFLAYIALNKLLAVFIYYFAPLLQKFIKSILLVCQTKTESDEKSSSNQKTVTNVNYTFREK